MGKNVPKLRFPNFKDDWQNIQLNSLLEFKNGINANGDMYGSGIKFINVLDILNNDFITYEKIIGRVNVDEKSIENNRVDYGDILFQRSSETREEVGTANVYLDTKPAIFGGFVIRGKKIGDYHPPFLNYLLKTPLARVEIMSKSGGSTRYNLSQSTLSDVSVMMPKMNEQLKIADFFLTIDSRISTQSSKLDSLQELKKGVMQRIFSQEIRFKREDGGEYTDWEHKRLGDVAILRNGYSFKSKEYKKSGQYRVITIKNVTGRRFVDCENVDKLNCLPQNIQEHQKLKIGDILISMTGNVGRVSINNSNNNLLNQRVGLIDYNRREIVGEFLYQSLTNDRFVDAMINSGQGAAQANIGKGDIENFMLEIPSLEEQQKIADFLSTLDSKISLESQILETLQTLKKGLLQQMFV